MQALAALLSRLISLYSFFIWIRIILSWFNPYPRPYSFTWYFSRMVDPYLGIFRSRKFVIGYFDLSPLLAVAVLSVVQSVLQLFAAFGTLRLSWIVAVFLQAFWSYGLSLFFWIAIIMMIFRTISAFSRGGTFSRMYNVMDPLVRKVQSLFFPRRLVKDTTLCVLTLAILIVLYFVCRYLVSMLITLAYRIPI